LVDPGRSDVRETAFWKNYFFHCEKVRTKLFQRRSKSPEPKKTFPREVVKTETKEVETSGLDDDHSLIPSSFTDDDSSYVNVIPSPPNSMNTFVSTKSVDDLVVVGYEGKRN
jgi:hypothetical protein